MPSRHIDEIRRLRDALDGLKVVACDMRHEAVRHEPVRDEASLDQAPRQEAERLVRPPLCPARARMGNIACSHTSARLLMRDAWLLLEKIGQPDATVQREELARVDYEISILDHRRYDAESEGRTDLVAVHVAQHRALGQEIEALRQALIGALDRAAAALS